MARLEMAHAENAGLGTNAVTGESFFRLGMMYSTGRSVEPDLKVAHKWFNIAAAKGHGDAVRYRQEVAQEMDRREIADAQRAAREWLRLH